MERPKALDMEDDRRRREKRRDGKSRSRRPGHQLDVIDKLDVTSIFGTGCKFLADMMTVSVYG